MATKTKRNKTDVEDQVLWIVFKKGSSGKDPPDSATKNEAKTVYTSGATAMAKQVFEYNFFLGKTATGKVYDYQLSPEWIEYVFNLVFTQLCRRFPGTWFHVPIGSARIEAELSENIVSAKSSAKSEAEILEETGSATIEAESSNNLATDVFIAYKQREDDYCLPYAIASCLFYMGHPTAAEGVSDQAGDWCCMPGDKVLDAVRNHMIEHLPSEGQAMVFNQKKSKRRKLVQLTCSELISERTPYLTLIRPVGKDGSMDHAVCVVDDLIFDS
jgi:hypothetical protein